MRPIFRSLGSLVVASAVLAASAADTARACTTFTLTSPKGLIFGRNYDFQIGDGMLVTNQRGVGKVAAVDAPGETPARWVSTYGSLTFNQYGREFPQGGMNEAGLVIELMWLDGTRYPAHDARPVVGELGWIQYMLDTCGTVSDVMASDARVRLSGTVPIHFLVADASGATSTMEFLDGKLVAHTGTGLGATVLANDTYDASTAYLKTHVGFGGSDAVPSGPASLDRFCRAATKVKAYSPASSGNAIAYAFGILDDVAQPEFTQWSVVYDVAARTIHFRSKGRRAIRTVRLRDFDFTCGAIVRTYDLTAPGSGNVSARFVAYSRAANRDLIGRAFGGVEFLKAVPAGALDALSAYPEQCPCVPPMHATGKR